MSDSFSHMIAITAYFKEINRVLSAVTASSKNRHLTCSVTTQIILNVSKDKKFSTRCSIAEIREVVWETNTCSIWFHSIKVISLLKINTKLPEIILLIMVKDTRFVTFTPKI